MSQNGALVVVGLGELLWDCFADSRRPGGAPANVAFQAGQLGGEGVVCSRVGADELGDELVAFLEQQGLATGYVQRDAEHRTGVVTVDTSRADHPTYVIHEDVAWDYLALDDGLKTLMGRAAAVCFGTLAQRSAASREAIQAALAATGPDCLIVYDVNLRQKWYDRPMVERSLAASRVVKLNAEEVIALDSLLGLDSADQKQFARAIIDRYGVEAVCITMAERGCVLFDDGRAIESPGVPVKVADAVGAGDAFTAAWIVSRLRGWAPEAQAAFANRVGSLVAGRPGAMPVLREEFARLAETYQ